MDKRTMTMNWEGLGDIEDDDRFFESFDRISSAVSIDLASSGSEDEEDDDFDDCRMSFASAISSISALSSAPPPEDFRKNPAAAVVSSSSSSSMVEDYDVWMAEPGSIKERRKRLLHGMGLSGDKELLRLTSSEFKRAASTKVGNCQVSQLMVTSSPSPSDESSKQEPSPSPLIPIVLVRSRSDGDIDSFSVHTKKRKEELIGTVSKQRLTRTYSTPSTQCGGMCRTNSMRVTSNEASSKLGTSVRKSRALSSLLSNSQFGAFFLIKNLDTGKEFIVNEFGEDGAWNRLSDIQTGKQLTREEFEKCVGYSPVVKELMRRENVSRIDDDGIGGSERKVSANSYLSKSFRNSKRRGVALLKNIKGVANSMSGLIIDKERENPPVTEQQRANKNSSSEWVKVRQHGKSYKELTALHLCQEIQAHQGSIWVIRFSLDAHYLASAGEDRIIHVWEVQECEVMSLRSPDEGANYSPFHSTCSSPDPSYLAESQSMPLEKKKKGKNSSSNRKNNSIPDYVYEPETVFSLSEKPVCSFKGHLDDVLDLSWSKSQLLLSSSMDKTVRLWDMETKSCLKLFAHNDYVTCIQFNPIDDRYFISGSLDAKVRIWSIPDRQVVDWTDLHEMVTAACYTPDGQGALIGSHKGSCRLYSLNDCKLNQTSQIEIHSKKKSHAKKITGFQFAPGNPSEVLITSADSRIRIYDGSEIIHKFRGFRNTSSQISASFSTDGKCVICASEDSQVYVWKREEVKNAGTGKSKGLITTRSHEHFQCRDVSVAIPWPGYIRGEPPPMPVHSKRHSKRSIPQPPSSNTSSPTREDSCLAASSKRQLPPLPKKHSTLERPAACPDEELAQVSRSDSGTGIGESFSSASASIRYGDSSSMSATGNASTSSWSSSWSLFDTGNNHGSHTVQPTAWGLVIVTAGVGGEIRAYQNFGLPVKIGRQTNLFRDLT